MVVMEKICVKGEQNRKDNNIKITGVHIIEQIEFKGFTIIVIRKKGCVQFIKEIFV